MRKRSSLIGVVYLFVYFPHERIEFVKNADFVSVRVGKPVCADWFGDYRSLRFWCGYFGSRTFYFTVFPTRGDYVEPAIWKSRTRVFQQENIEMRIYEALGVKIFRALVFKLEKFIHRRDRGKNVNYHIKTYEPLAINKFIKYLFYNGAIHVRNIAVFLLIFICRYAIFRVVSVMDVFLWLLFLKDCYCVMLQRYNYLRIQERCERIRDKQEKRIAAKAEMLRSTNSRYDWTFKESDLDFIESLRRCIEEGKCIEISSEEAERLARLSNLLNNDKRDRGEM